MGKRTWTKEQEEILQNLWGTRSYSHIAKMTDHTECAVRLKAKRMKLGPMKDYSDYICAREVARVMGVDGHTVINYWIKKRGLPCRKIKSKKRILWTLIRQDDLMEFLREHQDIWDSRRVEIYGLGEEPKWLRQKRTKDREKGEQVYVGNRLLP